MIAEILAKILVAAGKYATTEAAKAAVQRRLSKKSAQKRQQIISEVIRDLLVAKTPDLDRIEAKLALAEAGAADDSGDIARTRRLVTVARAYEKSKKKAAKRKSKRRATKRKAKKKAAKRKAKKKAAKRKA